MVTVARGSAWSCYENFNYINIKDSPYGALGDGLTDDTAAFVAALAVSGVPVFVPPGTYVVSTLALPNSKKLFGCGYSSVLKLKDTTNAPLLTATSIAALNLVDLMLDGNKANNTGTTVDILYLSGATQCLLSNILLYNALGSGIRIDGSAEYITLDNIISTGQVRNGITIENAANIDITSPRIYSSDVAAYPGDGIALAPAAAGNLVTNVRISGGVIQSCVGRGIAVAGYGGQNVTNSSVTGTTVKSNTSHGIHLLTTKQVMVCNAIAASNGGDGFRLEGNTTQSNITNGIADTNTGYGVREIISGSTPNYNGFIGCKAVGNVGSNTITKVGANSTIVT